MVLISLCGIKQFKELRFYVPLLWMCWDFQFNVEIDKGARVVSWIWNKIIQALSSFEKDGKILEKYSGL